MAQTVFAPPARPSPRRLRYPEAEAGRRDLRLDFLRGYCLFSMVTDHVAGPESWLYQITGRSPYTLVTGANGFVLISGVVMGIVYRQRIARDGLRAATASMLRRAALLYAVIVGLAFVTAALAAHTTLFGTKASPDHPLEYVIGVLTLHEATDGVLSLYFLLVLTTPLLFFLLEQGKTWMVLGGSWLVWLGQLVYADQFSQPVYVYFAFAAWQVIFVTGLVVGYHREWLATFLRGAWGAWYVVTVTTVAILLLALNMALITGLPARWFPNVDFSRIGAGFWDWEHMAPARLLATFTWFQTLYFLVTALWRPLAAALGWLLIPLGQAALPVYAMHWILLALLEKIPGVVTLPGLVYGCALLVPILLLWVVVRTGTLRKLPRKAAIPVIVAAVGLLFVPSPARTSPSPELVGDTPAPSIAIDAADAVGSSPAVGTFLNAVIPPVDCARPATVFFQMLRAMSGGTIVRATVASELPVQVLAAQGTGGRLFVMIANDTGADQTATVAVQNLPFGTATIRSRTQHSASAHSAACERSEMDNQTIYTMEDYAVNFPLIMGAYSMVLVVLEGMP